MVFSKFLPSIDNEILEWLSTDYYYSYLIPCTFIVTIIAIYLNWLGLKFFRHN